MGERISKRTNKKQLHSSSKRSSSKPTSTFNNNRPEVIAQRIIQKSSNTGPQVQRIAQLQTISQKEYNTGLPHQLKAGIESLSGQSLNDVKVHYNSPKPAQLQAHAFAQGSNIHLASGQEKHLPHEAWHVVQQKQGRVKPTKQLRSKVNINDDAGLEKEADEMGEKALQLRVSSNKTSSIHNSSKSSTTIQRAETVANVAGALAHAPDGPLHDLQVAVGIGGGGFDANNVIESLSLLGAGEKALVRADNAFMNPMATNLSVRQMFSAITILGGNLIWKFHWLGQGGIAAASIVNFKIDELINTSPNNEFDALLGNVVSRNVVFTHYTGNPFTWHPIIEDPAILRKGLAINELAHLMINNGKAPFALHYITQAGAATIQAFFNSGRLNTLLAGLPARNQFTSALKLNLKAFYDNITNNAGIEAIFNTLFGAGSGARLVRGLPKKQRAKSWDNNKAHRWHVKTNQIPAVAAGSINTVNTEAAKWWGAAPDQILRNVRTLSNADRTTARENNTLRDNLAYQFKEQLNPMLQIVHFLEITNPFTAFEWFNRAQVQNLLPTAEFHRLMYEATGLQTENIMRNQNMFNALHLHSHLNPLGIPGIVANNANFINIITHVLNFSNWALTYPGAPSFLNFTAHHNPNQAVDILANNHILPTLLHQLPNSNSLGAKYQGDLHTLFLATNVLATRKRLIGKRFGKDFMDWDNPGIAQAWTSLDKLPASHVAGNDWLHNFRGHEKPNGDGGVTGTFENPRNRGGYVNEVQVDYDHTKLGDLEAGPHYTDAGDRMQGLNVFNTTLNHETGHSVDNNSHIGNPQKFSQLAAFRNIAALGSWTEYNTGGNAGRTALYGALSNATGLIPVIAGMIVPLRARFRGINPGNIIKTAVLYNLEHSEEDASVGFREQLAHSYIWSKGGRFVAGNEYFEVWNKVRNHQMFTTINNGWASNFPWTNPYNVNGPRYYYESYSGRHGWWSFLKAARTDKLSIYSFRDPGEMFAEIYATFYETPDPGSRIRAWSPAVYNWFLTNVDKGHSVRKA
jgi:hypothetical protein